MALILDTGPVYATLDRRNGDHPACRTMVEHATERLVIPSPVLVEELRREDYRRIRSLCGRYADADIGFVGAARLAIVERLDEPKLVTLDQRRFGLLRAPRASDPPRRVVSVVLDPGLTRPPICACHAAPRLFQPYSDQPVTPRQRDARR